MHFEELWELCESLQKEEIQEKSSEILADEMMMKIKLYQHLDKKEFPTEEVQSIKSRTMGEILWTLTKLSLKDNINVFEALASSYQFHSISNLNQKHQG